MFGRMAQYAHKADFSADSFNSTSLIEGLANGYQVDELVAEIGQESQARIALVGRRGCGKRLLYNRMRGWSLQWEHPLILHDSVYVEPHGLFVLGDLPDMPDDPQGYLQSPDSLLVALGDPALVVYLLDALVGVTQADFRWVAALRTTGRPILVALNNADSAEIKCTAPQAAERLAMGIIPVSAYTGLNVEKRLLPAMLDTAPRLSVPLGRELIGLRQQAAMRVIRQVALFAGLLSTQPVPGLELPLLALLHVGMVMRIGATYGKQPGGGLNRETLTTITTVVLLQYGIQTVVKLVPVFGSLVSGVLGSLATLLIGRLAVRHYRAGWKLPRLRRSSRSSDHRPQGGIS